MGLAPNLPVVAVYGEELWQSVEQWVGAALGPHLFKPAQPYTPAQKCSC
jgi:hypothetical protein